MNLVDKIPKLTGKTCIMQALPARPNQKGKITL